MRVRPGVEYIHRARQDGTVQFHSHPSTAKHRPLTFLIGMHSCLGNHLKIPVFNSYILIRSYLKSIYTDTLIYRVALAYIQPGFTNK